MDYVKACSDYHKAKGKAQDELVKQAYKQGCEHGFDFCREAVIEVLEIVIDELKSDGVEVNFHVCD